MSKPIGIGFIGTGEISQLHEIAVKALPNAKLVGVWNRTHSTGIQRAEQYGCKWFETPDDLVKDPEIDAVFVLTNLETHLQYSRLAMEHGKHVLVEKPLAFTVADIEEMKALSENRGLVCMPGHNMIHEDSLKRAKGLIENGDLGKVVSCYVMYNIHHSEERASTLPGIVRHILTHNIYTMMYLVGYPRRVSAMKATRHYESLTQEDLAMVLVELENGGLAHLCASFAADDYSADPWTMLVKVIGTAGTTRYTYQDWVEIKKGYAHSHTYSAYQGSINNEVAHFVNVCLKGGAPLSNLDDAIVAQKVVEACERSIADGVTVAIK
ncbi:MAG: Gfo/Idh/MocA family protein [Anaerolineaceae bacterium]